MHSAIQVSCSENQDNKTCLSYESPDFTNKITAWHLKKWFDLCPILLLRVKFNWQQHLNWTSSELLEHTWNLSSVALRLCSNLSPPQSYQSCLFLQQIVQYVNVDRLYLMKAQQTHKLTYNVCLIHEEEIIFPLSCYYCPYGANHLFLPMPLLIRLVGPILYQFPSWW